jgi:hypothetical protein
MGEEVRVLQETIAPSQTIKNLEVIDPQPPQSVEAIEIMITASAFGERSLPPLTIKTEIPHLLSEGIE